MPDTETITVDATSTTTAATDAARQAASIQSPLKDEPLGDAGKLALQKEREDRKAADKRAKEAEDRLAAIDAERAKADEETAKKNGEFEALYKAELAKRETAERERDEDRKSLVRSRIAAKHRLPERLADRLSGATEEELEADATELAKLVTTREAPDTEAGAGTGTTRSKTSDRPIPKAPTQPDATQQAQPSHTFDGQRKVAWPAPR